MTSGPRVQVTVVTVPALPSADAIWSPIRSSAASTQPRSVVKNGWPGVVAIASPSMTTKPVTGSAWTQTALIG
jgi:glycerol dehydrogenase-like iron-containing ADH family enzyme